MHERGEMKTLMSGAFRDVCYACLGKNKTMEGEKTVHLKKSLQESQSAEQESFGSSANWLSALNYLKQSNGLVIVCDHKFGCLNHVASQDR